jgi:hypothetical protein
MIGLDHPLYHHPDGRLTTSHERQLIRRKQEQQDRVVSEKLKSRQPIEENHWQRLIDQAGNHSPTSKKGRQIARWKEEAAKWEQARAKEHAEQAEQERLAADPDVQAAVAVAQEWVLSAADDEARESAAYRLGLAKAGQLDEFWRLQAEVNEASAVERRQTAAEAEARHNKAAEEHYASEVLATKEQVKAVEARQNAERFRAE